jgi:hypothetical protein
VGTLNEDLYINGTLQAKSFVPPAGSVLNASVVGLAGISASKLQHQYQQVYAQPNATATTETKAIHLVYGLTSSILAFKTGSIVANIGAATVTVDLKKNGSSVLSAPVTLNNANTGRVAVSATVTGTTGAAGDLYEVVVTATAGGGTLATGVFAELIINEDAQ